MPYVPVPKDLGRVKSKIAFGLTKRQLICFSLAAVVGVPVYLLSRLAIGNTPAVLVMIVLMLPFFFIAMYEKDGLPAEKVLKNMLRHKLWPQQRPYRTENFYKTLSIKEGANIATQSKTAGKTPVAEHPAGRKKQGRRQGRA